MNTSHNQPNTNNSEEMGASATPKLANTALSTQADNLSDDMELSFEQQQEIDRLSLKANTPSSNQNKHRFNLYAYIEETIAQEANKARLDELNSVPESNDGVLDDYIYERIRKLTGRPDMILEYGVQQYNCLHRGWGKTNDGIETYWKCTDCGATQDIGGDLSAKTAPTPIPEYMKDVNSDPVGEFRGELR
jgi:hypothetical protein